MGKLKWYAAVIQFRALSRADAVDAVEALRFTIELASINLEHPGLMAVAKSLYVQEAPVGPDQPVLLPGRKNWQKKSRIAKQIPYTLLAKQSAPADQATAPEDE